MNLWINSLLPAADSIHSAATEGSQTGGSSTPFPRPTLGHSAQNRPMCYIMCNIINDEQHYARRLTVTVSLRTKPGSIKETAKYNSTDRTTRRKNRTGSSSSPCSSHFRKSAQTQHFDDEPNFSWTQGHCILEKKYMSQFQLTWIHIRLHMVFEILKKCLNVTLEKVYGPYHRNKINIYNI